MASVTTRGGGEPRTGPRTGPTDTADWEYRTLKRFDALRARDRSRPPCEELKELRAEMKVRLFREAKQAWEKTTQSVEADGPLRIAKLKSSDFPKGPYGQLAMGRSDIVLPTEYRRQCFACNYKICHDTPEERSTKVLMTSDWRKQDRVFPSVQEHHDQLEKREKQSLQRLLKTKPVPTPFQKYQQRQTAMKTARIAAQETSPPPRRQTRPTSWELIQRSISAEHAEDKAKASAKAAVALCPRHKAILDIEKKTQVTPKPRCRKPPTPETTYLEPIPARYLQRSSLNNMELFFLDIIRSPHKPPGAQST